MSTLDFCILCVVGWWGLTCTVVLLFAVAFRREDRRARESQRVVIELPVEHGHIVVRDLRQREHASWQ